jgi:hypothetical protein
VIRLTPDELARWRAEIDLGVEFRDKEFGTYRQQTPGAPPQTTLAGRNLDYFEQGSREDEGMQPPLNIVFPIIKNIVPSLFYQNPRATAIPDSRQNTAGDDAFYVSELLNRDLRDPDFRFKDTSQQTVFDSYALGYGVVKIGYATELGPDVLPNKEDNRKKLKEKLDDAKEKVLVSLGLKEPKPIESEPEQVQADTTIRSERPYISWISPFDFVIDPRARDLNDARWVAQRIRRTLGEIKRDRRYGQAKHELKAEGVDDSRVPETFVEEFETVDIWEVHYKDILAPTGIRVLTFAATQTQTKALMHDDSEYDLGGWQYEWLVLNKHGHRLYPVSTISVIRPLIDRINSSFDAILEQIDKFQAKIAYNSRVTADGEMALDNPTIGARVKIEGEGSVRDAIAVISMEQVKSDMMAFLNQVLDLVILITGLTRAQLTGLTQANTATEAQLGAAGQNLRRTDEANQVGAWVNRVVTKLWRVKSAFQDLEAIDLEQESAMLDPNTGMQTISWYPPIDSERASRLKKARYRFHIEVGSLQKANPEVARSQFEAMVRALMEPIVTQGLALEGKRLSATEIIRVWTKFFSEYGIIPDINKMVVPVSDPTQQQSLLNYGMKPEQANGQQSLAGSVPNMADLISKNSGERGQGVPLA